MRFVVKGKVTYSDCQQMRHFLLTSGTLSLATGETTLGAKEWKTDICGAPLFSDQERASGKCRSCAAGWTHPQNIIAP